MLLRPQRSGSPNKASPMSMVGFPLLLIPLAIYNIVVFLMPGLSFAEPIVKLTLMSGTEWPVTLSDILLALGILMLMFEVIKGARPGAKYLMDHLLALIVFGGAAAEFVLWPKFGTSTYFLLALLALADFLSGIALRARRGTVAAAATTVARKSTRKTETPAVEPQFDPTPAPAPVPAPVAVPEPAPAPAASVPPATSVAESARLDHPGPSVAQPAAASTAPASHAVSPEVASPELQPEGQQPGHSAPPSPDAPPR
jgi:hypothetical protein